MDWLLNGLHELISTLVLDIGYLLSPEWWRTHSVPLFNILMIDLTLAGDNAIVVGMAASRVQPSMRAKVIFWGIAGAVVLRIIFSSIAQQMLQVIGLTLAGGILLLFVAWKMYKQIVESDAHSIDEVEKSLASTEAHPNETSFWAALWTIILADLSMSLDNVLAVAGAAGESTLVLVIGLAIAILLMAVASTYIAKLLARYPWIAWFGLLIILYVALDMIYRDSHRIVCAQYGVGCSETIWQGIKHRLGFGG
ncbi:MAG: TerC family protein [Hyphomicrobium denitrificans]|uniref:Integral membrane protein TerC n=1 Tax=Hyphomicrobium denitrificans (strain ATCC 51888 / DSM 1869 / NCIMB 11706 / TK 0415) TaxID=582899 RepID=D8JX63_HYPDA|nr:TerC family protein [Hyphomicrobium denitrificans]ADJ23199.1 Integral membrane protein TerC [Hyphomicrobium denitrificans ATCC 51888]MBN9291940.1 TerC family protein [Hyphomicrobium denitrificans]